MSGGHWNYSGFIIQDSLKTIAEDIKVKTRWPLVSKMFNALADIIYDAEHDMDWTISGDGSIRNNREFDAVIFNRIKTMCKKLEKEM